jgi:hypothetical protein
MHVRFKCDDPIRVMEETEFGDGAERLDMSNSEN